MAIEKDKSLGKRFKIACVRCDNQTWHLVVASADDEGVDDGVGYQYGLNCQVVQCQGCDDLSFRKRMWDETEPHDTIEIYPPRVAGRKPLRRLGLLPPQVGRIYRETHAAMCSSQPILAGVGVRALVEAVCNEKKASGRNLKDRIDDLVTKGVLTPAGATVLHRTRFLGNQAAHEASPASELVLDAAMEVAEHLLQTVYLIEKTARRLPSK